MSSIFHSIVEFWISYGPWIGAALIPTVIAGLSLSPKTAATATLIGQVWSLIKQAMGLLSLATFKDQPGTFQLPLKLGKVVSKKTSSTGIIALFFLAHTSSCAWLKSDAKSIGNTILHCAGQEVKDVASELVPTLITAVGSHTSFDKIVEGLINQFGLNIVGCAALDAKKELAARIPVGGPIANNPTVIELNKLNTLIASKKWVSGE